MKISEIQAQQNASLDDVEITDKQDPRTFEKFGKVNRVCNATIKDDSGEMTLTLWNDEIDAVNQGDHIKITDGWVKEWNGNLQISAGRNGKIEKAGAAAPAAEEAPAEEPAE